MILIGTLVNTLAVLAGSAMGLLLTWLERWLRRPADLPPAKRSLL